HTRLAYMFSFYYHLQANNLSMLERLRPMSLGHVPLKDILGELVREQEQRHAAISFRFSAADVERSYGDSIDLTVYRCLQESLTNAVRHAQAQHITIELRAEAERRLALTVRDDGCGIHPGKVRDSACTACRSASKASVVAMRSRAKRATARAFA